MVEEPKKSKTSKWFYLVPLLATALAVIIFIILAIIKKMSWTSVIIYSVVVLIASSVISLIIALATAKSEPKGERKYHDRKFLEECIRNEFIGRGRNINPFTDTQHSFARIITYGGEKFFAELFRDADPSIQYYYMVVINMEEGKEDMLSIEQTPQNYTEAGKVAQMKSMVEDLAEKKEKPTIIEKTITDELSGRVSMEKTEKPEEEKKEEDVIQD